MIKKGLLIKISIFVLSSILSFILLEISFRYTIFGSDSLNYEKMNSVTPLGLSGLIEPSRDREIVYQLKSNSIRTSRWPDLKPTPKDFGIRNIR